MDFIGCENCLHSFTYMFETKPYVSHDLKGATLEQTTQDRTTSLPAGAEGFYRVFEDYIVYSGCGRSGKSENMCSFISLRNRGYMWSPICLDWGSGEKS